MLSKRQLPRRRPTARKGKEEYWTGKQLFSLIAPEGPQDRVQGLDLGASATVCQKDKCDLDAYVMIRERRSCCRHHRREGDRLRSRARSSTRSPGTTARTRAREFLDNITRLAIGAIMVKGLHDRHRRRGHPRGGARRRSRRSRTTRSARVDELVAAYRKGELEQMPGRSLEETLEVRS